MIGEVVRGGVYYARTARGGERPVVVVSWDSLNHGLRRPVICEVTSVERARTLPTAVRLPEGEAGLDRPSYALCHELATIGVEQFRRELGRLSSERLSEIEVALRVVFHLG